MKRPTRARRRPVVPHPSDPSVALIELTHGMWAIIDAADAHAAANFNWRVRVSRYTAYALRSTTPGHCEFLHRFIAARSGLQTDQQIDHVNGNGLDCRRSNLRAASASQNQCNKRRQRNNSSGVKGVTWDGGRRKWRATLKVRGAYVAAGRFDTIQEAAAAVAAARTALHGDFARHN